MEANIMNSLCSSLFPKRRFETSSGKFLVDFNGALLSFEPSESNPIYYTEKEHILNPYLPTEVVKEEHLRELIIPEGVKGLPSDFMRGYHIEEKIVFPSSLEAIGDIRWDDMSHECHCALANTYLPEVVIPRSVKMIGTYAYGGSHIKRLVFEGVVECEYARQLKDCGIDELVIPKSMWEGDSGLVKSIKMNSGGIEKLVLR